MAIISPGQKLPKPGAPAASPCGGGKYCASLSFRNGTTGYIPPTAPAPTNCLLTVTADGTVLANTTYDILVYDKAKKFCAANDAADKKIFAVTPGSHAYRFTVYFKCPSPNNTPMVTLTIDWQ